MHASDSVEEILEKFAVTTIDDRGRVYIPSSIRKKLGMKSGEKMYLKLEDNRLSLFIRRVH